MPMPVPMPVPGPVPARVFAQRPEPLHAARILGAPGFGDAPVPGATYCATGDTTETEEEEEDEGRGVFVGMTEEEEEEDESCGIGTGDTTEEEEQGCGDTTETEEEEDKRAASWHDMHLALRAELMTTGVPSRRSWEWLRSQVQGPMNGGVQEYRARMLDDMLRHAGYSLPRSRRRRASNKQTAPRVQ
jgi:hypothetical protein